MRLPAGLVAASLVIGLAGTVGMPGVRAADRVPVSRAEATLMKAESGFVQDMARGDAAALGRALADEAVFGHGDGSVQDKAGFIRTFGAPRTGVSRAGAASIELTGRTARIHGDIGITRGRQVLNMGGGMHMDRYLGIYIRRDGRWQLLDWQTTPIAAPHAGDGAGK